MTLVGNMTYFEVPIKHSSHGYWSSVACQCYDFCELPYLQHIHEKILYPIIIYTLSPHNKKLMNKTSIPSGR